MCYMSVMPNIDVFSHHSGSMSHDYLRFKMSDRECIARKRDCEVLSSYRRISKSNFSFSEIFLYFWNYVLNKV